MSAQRRKIARRLEKSPSLKRELSEMAVESYGDAVLSAASEKSFPCLKCRGRSLMRCATISSWTDTLTMMNRTQWPVFLCLRGVIVCRIAGANKQNSLSVTAGKGSNLWARSFLTCTNPAALTCLLNVLVHLT